MGESNGTALSKGSQRAWLAHTALAKKPVLPEVLPEPTPDPYAGFNPQFVKIAPNTYRKWNPALRIRTTIVFDKSGEKIHVRHEQPKEDVAFILDRNVKMQNDWKGRYGGDLITQTTRIPISLHSQIMAKCGFEQGVGYDEKKFKSILNDSDYRHLKTVPGKL